LAITAMFHADGLTLQAIRNMRIVRNYECTQTKWENRQIIYTVIALANWVATV